jgi:hypothetical protein
VNCIQVCDLGAHAQSVQRDNHLLRQTRGKAALFANVAVVSLPIAESLQCVNYCAGAILKDALIGNIAVFTERSPALELAALLGAFTPSDVDVWWT